MRFNRRLRAYVRGLPIKCRSDQLAVRGIYFFEERSRNVNIADKHFNVLGRYHFTVTDSILRGELRPLRVPAAPEELFWAVGA